MLGVGGFGEVWKAADPSHEGVAPVALKFCTDPEAAKTLRHEKGVLNEVMRRFHHPGIVRLQHSYLKAEPPFLEFEYVEGGDLAGIIRDWHSGGTFAPRRQHVSCWSWPRSSATPTGSARPSSTAI